MTVETLLSYVLANVMWRFKMKKRKEITHVLRDSWIKNWKIENERSIHYLSYTKTQDLKSMGAKSRTPDYQRPGQDRNLLSTNERLFFLQLLFNHKITWIKEQYPLLPIDRAMAVAKVLKLRYPTYPYTASVPVVMTSDFYCGTIFGTSVVYSIKDERVLGTSLELTEQKIKNLEAKQKIEKLFWRADNVNWHIISSKSIKTVFSRNLEKLAPYIRLNLEYELIIVAWLKLFSLYISNYPIAQFRDAFDNTAQAISVPYAVVVSMFQHAVWHRIIRVDLNQPLHYEKSICGYKLGVNRHG